MDIVEKLRNQRTMSMFAKSEHLYEALNHDRREAADEIERLRAYVAHLAVPVGYKLVPIRPTPEMLHAGVRAWWDNPVIEDGAPEEMLRPYRAMVEAAPERQS